MIRSSSRLAAAAALPLLLSACSSGSDDTSDEAKPTQTTESTSTVPKGSGDGDITGTADGQDVSDTWRVGCSDAGNSLYEINALGTPQNTIQGKIEGRKVLELVISFHDLLGGNEKSDPRVKAETLDDGFRITGKVDFADKRNRPIDLKITCEE